jgi:hypothetical protein
MAGDDLDEDAAAVAIGVFTVELDERIFAGGEARGLKNTGFWLEMNAAYFALGDFR